MRSKHWSGQAEISDFISTSSMERHAVCCSNTILPVMGK